MEAYEGFAQVYDELMDNIPYEEWGSYLLGLLEEYGVSKGLVLDMGCGTGSITELLCEAGYDMIGIDNSEDMLSIAREKAIEKGMDILYLLQDMRELELYGTVAAVVSICDSMNYITEEEELLEVFRLVNNYLDAGGLFIFDLNTVYKYEKLLADNVIAENREDCAFIWENYYDRESRINEYDLSIYVEEEEDLFRRYSEIHYQKAYPLELVRELLEKAGMEFVTAYDAFTRKPPMAESERIYVIAREKKQEGKLYLS